MFNRVIHNNSLNCYSEINSNIQLFARVQCSRPYIVTTIGCAQLVIPIGQRLYNSIWFYYNRLIRSSFCCVRELLVYTWIECTCEAYTRALAIQGRAHTMIEQNVNYKKMIWCAQQWRRRRNPDLRTKMQTTTIIHYCTYYFHLFAYYLWSRQKLCESSSGRPARPPIYLTLIQVPLRFVCFIRTTYLLYWHSMANSMGKSN